MKQTRTYNQRANKAGAELGPRGYVLCLACHNEVEEISKETDPESAYHPDHRPWVVEDKQKRQELNERALNMMKRREIPSEQQGGLYQ